jgi:pimeloyl-ACP methyl ester carboxylesterase
MMATVQTGVAVAPDGVKLATYEAGNPDGAEILFIHGISQCALCWQRQFEDDGLLREFRLTAFDIRGHGGSDKPLDPARYADDRLFAEDVWSVMQALGLRRPVMVAWSYAGRIVSDYVKTFGTAGIAGINYVGARTNSAPRFRGPGSFNLEVMAGKDLARNIAATRAFLAACFAKPPPRDEFETALAYNMLMPAEVRAAQIARHPNDGAALAMIDVPVLVTQGTEDQLVLPGMSELTASRIPGAVLSLYDGIGHCPFAEDAPRFNRELASFARSGGGRCSVTS